MLNIHTEVENILAPFTGWERNKLKRLAIFAITNLPSEQVIETFSDRLDAWSISRDGREAIAQIVQLNSDNRNYRTLRHILGADEDERAGHARRGR